MNLKSLTLAATLATASLTAFATPQYNGNTFGSELAANSAAGYYLWNDITSPNDWHLRWTGTDASESTPKFSGNIRFNNSNLDSASKYSFETGGTYGDHLQVTMDNIFDSNTDSLGWVAYTNNTGGIDGIDFSLGQGIELMGISLGSSIFNGLAESIVDPGVASTGIFIGSGFEGTNVLVSSANGMTYQSFEVSVNEPATLALLGLGLIGLGFARRNQAKI
tara:strand:- start:232 stop:894 length:663 start_codon:yes stop_codon:yes gene_type:complete